MNVVLEKKLETIKVPIAYKNIFLKIVENFSAEEIEEKIFNKNDIISQKIKEINEKEKNGKINFVSFEKGEKQGDNFLKNLFNN